MEIAGDVKQNDLLVGKRVLTVEDEGIIQMQLARILKAAGMEQVGQAVNGPQGVNLALTVRPDLILMDINMPGEFNGLEAARRILNEFTTCIVILTAYPDYAEQARNIGIHGYNIKPLERLSLLNHLREALMRFQAGERLP